MKKLIILGTALLALNAVASEFQIKGGYDFYRKAKLGTDDGGWKNDYKFKNGPTLGVEYIIDNQGEFEWGIGAEYKLSANSGKLKRKSDNEKIMRSVPVYLLGKFNLITTQNGNDALYLLGRAGYNFAHGTKDSSKWGFAIHDRIKGGLYVAAGIGTEFGPVSLEAIYERASFKNKFDAGNGETRTRNHVDSAGVRVGYRFGQLVNDRSPKIIERIVTVEKEKEKEPEETFTLPFSCSASQKKCIIRGFKVDGRVPNEAEIKDLRIIANTINRFAEGGTIDFIGHTDSTGSDAYNQKLSVARAQNVASLLRQYGLKNTINYGRINGEGERNPVSTNETVEGRYNNRRVELFFQNVDFSNVIFK